MDFADLFGQEVRQVDVYVFDENGKFLFSRSSLRDQLTDGNRMSLGPQCSGIYKIFTIGNLSREFTFPDADNNECVPGVTTLDDVRLALKRQSAGVSHKFPHLWVSPTVTVNHGGNTAVQISLIRNTNEFYVTIDRPAFHTLQIVIPEGAVYDPDNNPTSTETVTYSPHHYDTDPAAGQITGGQINTMRLLRTHQPGYRIILRDAQTQSIVWQDNLMQLLEESKPATRPDGTPLPVQEYLDRQWKWNITLYIGCPPDDKIIVIGIRINGWIKWFDTIEV